jgi:hypothetical protein
MQARDSRLARNEKVFGSSPKVGFEAHGVRNTARRWSTCEYPKLTGLTKRRPTPTLARCRGVLEGQHLAGSVTLLGLPYWIFFLPLVLALTVKHL